MVSLVGLTASRVGRFKNTSVCSVENLARDKRREILTPTGSSSDAASVASLRVAATQCPPWINARPLLLHNPSALFLSHDLARPCILIYEIVFGLGESRKTRLENSNFELNIFLYGCCERVGLSLGRGTITESWPVEAYLASETDIASHGNYFWRRQWRGRTLFFSGWLQFRIAFFYNKKHTFFL